MPNDTTPFLRPTDPNKPFMDPVDYDAFRERIAKLAATTREVKGPKKLPIGMPDVPKRVGGTAGQPFPGVGAFATGSGISLMGGRQAMEASWAAGHPGSPGADTSMTRAATAARYQAAVSAFDTQRKEKEQQAEKGASALEMMGAQTEMSMRKLYQLEGEARGQRDTAAAAWGAAAEKADEYVDASRARVGEVLGKLDEINDEIGRNRDFAKAHAMQASVEASLGAMKKEERNINETYGVDSPEAMQFKESKTRSLATVQSNIHATFQQLQEEQDKTYMATTNEAMWKQNMYTSFQEQQHVETLRYLAQANDSYSLQTSQFMVGIEQLRSQGMENLANWIVQTPVYSMDVVPLIEMVVGGLA